VRTSAIAQRRTPAGNDTGRRHRISTTDLDHIAYRIPKGHRAAGVRFRPHLLAPCFGRAKRPPSGDTVVGHIDLPQAALPMAAGRIQLCPAPPLPAPWDDRRDTAPLKKTTFRRPRDRPASPAIISLIIRGIDFGKLRDCDHGAVSLGPLHAKMDHPSRDRSRPKQLSLGPRRLERWTVSFWRTETRSQIDVADAHPLSTCLPD